MLFEYTGQTLPYQVGRYTLTEKKQRIYVPQNDISLLMENGHFSQV